MGRMHCLLVAAAVLWVAVAAAETVDSWNACGGSQYCPCGTFNCDMQWPGQKCKEWDSCTRSDQTWWRCEPRSNVCDKTVNTWDNCGGGWQCQPGDKCDAPWYKHCCKHGDVCVRKDPSWWRCEPADVHKDNNVCWSFATTWASCSKDDKVCCSVPGDTCVYQNKKWSRCEPRDGKSPAQPPRGTPPPPLAIAGNRIVRADTRETILLRGINWFGFNVARTAVDGLGHGGSNAQTDFATLAYELKLLGYNTVRLPFRYRDLDQWYPKDFTVKCWEMSQEDLRRRMMEPGQWTDKPLPNNPAQVDRPRGTCNGYLPSINTYTRFMYTIQTFIAQGMYVVLDYQPMGTEPQAYNVKEFVCKWRVLMSHVLALPNFWDDIKDRIFVDVMNEPDSMGMQWEPVNNKPGARELYIETMDALHDLSSQGWLYMVEGAGQNGLGLNWGNGFITDTNIISRYKISDANRFFKTLWDKPYVDRVVMTPHVYPPSITKTVFLGDTLWQQCALAFGYLEEKGYCKWQGNCRKFPVVVGETGSFLHDDKDKQWMQDFADFTEARGGARSYKTQRMAGWMWWVYNENSGDTGGIVWDNWSKWDWDKLRLMVYKFELWPWYKW